MKTLAMSFMHSGTTLLVQFWEVASVFCFCFNLYTERQLEDDVDVVSECFLNCRL